LNGGPWLILENVNVPYVMDQNRVSRALDLGDVNRAVALLTDATVTHYDLTGEHHAGLPSVEIELGAPVGGVSVAGNIYRREFERGNVTLSLGTGTYPSGFSFWISNSDSLVVQEMSPSYIYP
jgi:hypothetical protein